MRFSTTGANMVSRTKERALDPLSVPALPTLVTPSICSLRSASASDTLAQHPCSSTAVRATAGSSGGSATALEPERALKSCVPLAPSQPPAAQSPGVMAEHVVASSYGASWARSKREKNVFGENTLFETYALKP